MTATLRLLGWKAEGLRCPDHNVDCCDHSGTPYPVSLIQMPNGTGKTTTLTLLRAALSGTFSDGTSDPVRIRAFQKRGSDQDHGTFEVRLLLNNRRVTIVMSFDFDRGRLSYKTTRDAGQVEAFDPPLEFRRFLSEDFVKFFVFDGELAEHLLDRRQVHAEAVVETLFQINSLETLAKRVTEYWDLMTRHASATEERGLTRRENKVEKLRDRLAFLKGERRKRKDLRVSLAAELKQQRDAYDQEIKKEETRSQQLTAAESRLDQLKAKTREHALDVLDLMREPHSVSTVFAQAVYELKLGLDRVKLPESAAREFFEELATETDCVCGRPIDAYISDVIRDRARQYLGSDDVSLLNSMKTAVQEAVGQSRDAAAAILSSEMAQLEDMVNERRDALNELEELRLQAEQSDPAVKLARDLVRNLEERLTGVEGALEAFESKEDDQPDDRTFGIGIIERRLIDAEKKLAEITQTIELKDKRDILTRIISNAHRKARELITGELCEAANQCIREIMPFNNITIDRIERCLVLSDQEGASAGETLSVAYAFLATLFHRSDHQLPFIVDSPAGPIDLAARPRIGELVPKLTGQFVAFTISSERDGFIPRLKEAANGGVQFITLFRKGAVAFDAANSGLDQTETADGIMVRGESFFNQFQLDAEE